MNDATAMLCARGYTMWCSTLEPAAWRKLTGGDEHYSISVTDGAGACPPRPDSWCVTLRHYPNVGTLGETVTVWSRANFPTLADALDMAELWTAAPLALLRYIQRQSLERHAASAPCDPLAELAPELRAWLVDEMGMEAEMTGGGCYVLRHQGPGGWHMWVSGFDGHLPEPGNWAVGVYCFGDDTDVSEPLWFESHSIGEGIDQPSKLTLRQAVAAGCSIMAQAPLPTDPIEKATRYAAALDQMEICPNGDDFNALLEMLGGADFRFPHVKGR